MYDQPAGSRRLWLIIVAVVVIGIAGVYAYNSHQEAEAQALANARYACSLAYQEHTTEWENCVADR